MTGGAAERPEARRSKFRHPDLSTSSCASQGNRMIPVLPKKAAAIRRSTPAPPRHWRGGDDRPRSSASDQLRCRRLDPVARNSERVSTAFGAASRDAVGFPNAALFVQRRTRGSARPHRGIFLFVEPIAHTAAECRGYNRAVARVGMTGLGSPAVGAVSRDTVEFTNAAPFVLGGLIGFPGESGCLTLEIKIRPRE